MKHNFFKVGRSQQGKQLICDYYVIHKRKSNYIYVAMEDVHCYGMDRKFLHNEILKNFPDVEFHLTLSTLFFYNKLISKPMSDFKAKHFEELNRKSKGSASVRLILNKNLPKDLNLPETLT